MVVAGVAGGRNFFTDDRVMGICVTGHQVMGARVATRVPVTR